MYYVGPVLILIASISLKINAAMQNSLYGGTAFQPLCQEGFFPHKLATFNKDGIPVRASLLNLVIVGIFIFIWLAIPDIIKGVTCYGQK
jgi:amino acid transporter